MHQKKFKKSIRASLLRTHFCTLELGKKREKNLEGNTRNLFLLLQELAYKDRQCSRTS